MAGIVGVIVAGGKASRMKNLDKPLLPLAGKPIIEHVIDLARPQVDELVISANRNLDGYRRFNLPLVSDLTASYEGPLVGICSAMQWFHDCGVNADYLACFPADVPAFPSDIAKQLRTSLEQLADSTQDKASISNTVAWCQTGQQVQPLFSLWPFAVLNSLKQAVNEGIHGPRLFFRDNPDVVLLLPAPQPPQFLNINTPEQLIEAKQLFGDTDQNR